MVFLKISSPLCIRSDLELHREKDGSEHVRREPGGRAEIGITVLHKGIHFREVKVPEFFHDLPGGSWKRAGSIWIIFTKLFQDTVLVGGMSASVNRFQNRNTPDQTVCTGCAGTICLFDQGREAPHFLGVLSTPFLKKLGEFTKKEPQRPHKKRLRDSESLL